MLDNKELNAILARYKTPDRKRGIWQIVNSFIPYFLCWYLMVLSTSVSYWLTVALAIPAAGFLIRIFIIAHDCGHGSFFKSRRANDFWGIIGSFLAFTPYYEWRHEHAIHHSTSGNLDKVGMGSVWSLTVEQYRNASTWEKFQYRIYRNPFILFTIGALIRFLFIQRFTNSISNKKDRWSIYFTNVGLVVTAVLLSLLIGLKEYLIIQLSIMAFASSVGVWLFYLQHQFQGVYWERQEKWDRVKASLQGSSFYKLPKVLQWFTGNIGFHHIHHLSPLIPNYNLEKCYKENPVFQDVKPVTLRSGFKSLFLRLYDEKTRKMVGYPPYAPGGPNPF